MHERYRIGTRLEKILNSARTLRKNGKMNDYAQCIRFNYNSDDLDSEKFRDMANEFSHVYMTETFYPKDVSTYKRKFNLVDFVPNRHKISKYDMLKKLAEVGYNTLKNDKAVCQSMQFKR